MEAVDQLEAPQVDEQQPEDQGDPVEQYYNYLKKAGADVPGSVDSFKKTLSDPSSAKQYYDYVKKNGFDAPPTYDSFAKTLGTTSGLAFPKLDYRKPVQQETPTEQANNHIVPQNIPRETSDIQIQKRHQDAISLLHSELQGNNDLIPNLIKTQKEQAQSQQNLTNFAQAPRSDQPLTHPQQLAQQMAPPEQAPDVSPQDMYDFSNSIMNDPTAGRAFLQHVTQAKPDKAKPIQAALYVNDAMTRLSKDADGGDKNPAADPKVNKVLENAKKIDKGQLDYGVQGGILTKPEGAWESIATGLQQKNKAFTDYALFSNATPEQAIQELEKRRTEHDPDEPVPVPKGFAAQLTGGMAGQPIKGLIAGKLAGGITTMAGGPEAAPAVDKFISAAVSSNDFRKMSYAHSLQDNYNQLRNEGMSSEDAYRKANGQAKDEAMVDAIAGGAMMYAAGAIGEMKLPSFAASQGFKTTLTTALKQGAKGIGEAGAVGLIQGAAQDAKNQLADAKGIARNGDGKDIGEAMESGALFTLGMAALAKGGSLLSGKTRSALLQSLSKATPEQVNAELGHQIMEEHITPQEATEASKAIDEHRTLDAGIPDNVTEDARMKIQDKIKRRDYLEMQLESADKAFHPEIKEKIKTVNEDILELAKDKVPRGTEDVLSPKPITDEETNQAQAGQVGEQPTGGAEEPSGSVAAPSISVGDQVASDHFEGTRKVVHVSEDGTHVVVEDPGGAHIKHEIPITDIKNKSSSVFNPLDTSRHENDTQGLESTPNSEGAAPDFFSDDGSRKAFVEKGFNSLGINEKGLVVSRMIAAIHDQKVVEAIVKSVPVDMMNDLMGKEFSSKSSFSQKDMLLKSLSFDPENPIPTSVGKVVDQLLPFIMRDKSSIPTDNRTIDSLSGRVSTKRDSAMLTNEFHESKDTQKEQAKQLSPDKSQEDGKIISTKNKVADVIRNDNGLPPVEIPKDRTQDESLNAWKDGTRTPQQIVDHLLSDKDIYNKSITPNDEPIMREYIRGLVNRGMELNKVNEELAEKAKSGDEKAVAEHATVKQQLLNHYDEMARALDAERIGGNIWHKYGMERQIAVNEQGQVVNSINRIKTIYGDDMPPEVKKQLSDLQQKYDSLVAKNSKIEDDLKKAQVENDLLRQSADNKKSGKRAKKTDSDFKKERKDILADMKTALKDANKKMYSAIPLTPQLAAIAPHVLKLFRSFGEEGVDKLSEMIDKIHDVVKDVVDGISKDDILDILAGKHSEKPVLSELQKKLTDLRTQAKLTSHIADLEKGISIAAKKKGEQSPEVEKLKTQLAEAKKKSLDQYAHLSAEESKKQIATIQKQIDKGDYFKMPTVKKKWENDPEWKKNEQAKADLKQKLRNLEQHAFDSKKNLYMKSLDWINRWGRRVIFFGANAVYTKLSSAAVLGAFAHRIPETLLGKVNKKIFPHIAENAPIEGNLNASSEAKFYKEFLNPAKFARNIWSQAKSGETPLSKELGRHSNEKHIPVVDLFAADVHVMIKDPVKRAAFEAAVVAHLAFYANNSIDGTHPLMLESARQAAYKTAEYEIFQNSAKNAGGVKKFFADLEKSGVVNANMPDGWSKAKGNAQYTAAALYHFFVPVNTVPVNILKRVGLGLSTPVTMIKAMSTNKAIRDGIMNMSQEESDLLMRQLKKGQIGTAYWTLGFILGGQALGGLYTKYDPDKERGNHPKINEMNVGDTNIPKDVQHNTQFQSLQMGATWKTVYDHFIDDKGASQMEALAKATAATAGGAAESVPTLKEAANIYEATQTPYGGAKFVKDLKNRVGLGKAQSLLQMMGYGDEPIFGGGSGGGGGAGDTYKVKEWK